MREILFQGKRVDNGEWVEGYVLEKFSLDGEPPLMVIDTCRKFENDGVASLESYFVIPETVGQYVWKHDVKGNRVFNGDIVKTKYNNLVIIKPSGAGYAPYRNKDGDYTKITNWGCVESGEVIGNVHDKEEGK